MAIQQLIQPIINPIAAFDATVKQIIPFTVIGGAQVIGNRIVIKNNRTGVEVYNHYVPTMKLENYIPANTLTNGEYYNAVIYTSDSSGDESAPSTAVPFYCYSQPVLTINNIPENRIIQNGTYTFQGNYLQQQSESLDSYQYTLYDSNQEVLSKSPLIYYQTNSSLEYTFKGMTNNANYYITLTGETVNKTKITTGLLNFTVKYITPASFAICELVNDCDNGYIQISSNIIAIDGHANPEPPIYIDNKEVDLTKPDSWVEWNAGFDIRNDFTMRVWGRKFNEYEDIITLRNNLDSTALPNKINMKWMVGDIMKILPEYMNVTGNGINLQKSEENDIKDLALGGNTVQNSDPADPGITIIDNPIYIDDANPEKKSELNILGDTKQKTMEGYNLIKKEGFSTSKTDTDFWRSVSSNFTPLTDGWGRANFDGKQTSQWCNSMIKVEGLDIKPNTKYTIIFEVKNLQGEINLAFGEFKDESFFGTYPPSITQNGIYKVLVTSKVDISNKIFRVFTASKTLTEVCSVEYRAMILEGDHTKDNLPYEPYTGGQPSPSLDYPQEVECVKAYNLLNSGLQNQKINGLDVKVNSDKSVTINGTATQSTELRLATNYNLEENIKYILQGCPQGGNLESTYRLQTNQYYDNISHFSHDIGQGIEFTYNAKSSNSNNVSIIIGKDYVAKNLIFKPMITTIENEYKPYQPYGQIEVKQIGKNLFDINNQYKFGQSFEHKGIKVTYNDDYSITLNGTVTANGDIDVVPHEYSLKLNNNIYCYIDYISGNIDRVPGFTWQQVLNDGTNDWTVNARLYSNKAEPQLIELNPKVELCKWFRIVIRKGYTFNNYRFKIMISKYKPTIYEPYKEKLYPIKLGDTELCKIDNAQDYYEKIGDKWYLHKANLQRILTGNENYELIVQGESLATQNNEELITQNGEVISLNSDLIGFSVNLPNSSTNATRSSVYSNYFQYNPSENIYNYGLCYILNSKLYMYPKETIKTVDQFKTFLRERNANAQPVKILYPAENIENIEITDPILISQLNDLNQAKLYSGVNNFNIISYDDLGYLKLHYNFAYATPNPEYPEKIYNLGEHKNLINVPNFNINYSQEYFKAVNTNLELNPNYIYTLSFDYYVNTATTDIYYSIGYGKNSYETDIIANKQYSNLLEGKNTISFVAPENIPANSKLWIKFGQTIILSDINVDISNVQLEYGSQATEYQDPNLYNIYPTAAGKNIYNYKAPKYFKQENIKYKEIPNGYHMEPIVQNKSSMLRIGYSNHLIPGLTYAISFEKYGNIKGFHLYLVDKETQQIKEEIKINNRVFVAPKSFYDLQLVFDIDSSDLTNVVEVWNIQIEVADYPTEFEPYKSNNVDIVLDKPLNGIYRARDLICLESPNLLNSEDQSCKVSGNTTYYFNQKGNTTYYVWYYNAIGKLIKFMDSEGKEQSGVSLVQGSFTTHEDCVKLVITKTNNPELLDLTKEEAMNNQIAVVLGDKAINYYPYAPQPSRINKIGKYVFTGDEKWDIESSGRFRTQKFQKIIKKTPNNIIANIKSNCFKAYTSNDTWHNKTINGISVDSSGNINIRILNYINLNQFKQLLKDKYNSGNPVIVYYELENPTIESVSKENIVALTQLKTYNPITNVYTNNSILGYTDFDYVDNYSRQYAKNAYVQLQCFNSNNMPYFIHSNYIDIPKDTDKVFIWTRRKNNLFDLKLENLGDYNEGDTPIEVNKPVVSLTVNLSQITSNKIPITVSAVDESGLETLRFSKDNGQTWDSVLRVDGLSTTTNYVFNNLLPNTEYIIRVEAVDISGNVGGMSERVRTK